MKHKVLIEDWLNLYDSGKKSLPDHNKKREYNN